MVAENFNAVAFFTGNSGYVNHCYVHTNVANVRSFLPINQTVGAAIAQMAVQSVGIAYGYSCNNAVAGNFSTSTIANGIACRNVTQLKNGSFQCAYVVDDGVGTGIDTVKTEPESAHIKLSVGKVFDTCRVVDMA